MCKVHNVTFNCDHNNLFKTVIAQQIEINNNLD